MEKTFGRADDNAVIIKKADISNHHAKVTFSGNGNFFIEDLGSTNGVYINGHRIQKAHVSLKDEVRLSESTILNLAEIFKLNVPKAPSPPKNSQKDFRWEFAELKQVWDDYQTKRIDINKKHQTRSTIIRSILQLSPLVIWEIFNSAYLQQFKNTDLEYYQSWQGKFLYFSIIGGSIGTAITGIFIESPQAKLIELDEEFRVRYVCPNPSCRNQLGNSSWTVYYLQGKCFRCQAKYSEEGG